jgi:hypothetical protein
MKDGEDIAFDQLLVNLKVTEQKYLLCHSIQSSGTNNYILRKKTK